MLLEKNQAIGSYTVVFPLSQRCYADIYSVKDCNGRFRFLKLIYFDRLPSSSFNERGQLNEIVIRKQLHHDSISRYVDSMEITVQNQLCCCLVTDYVSAESVRSRINREGRMSVYETKNVIGNLLKVLQYLHGRENPIIHNAIAPENVLLDLAGQTGKCILTDFSQSGFLRQGDCGAGLDGLSPAFVAPERREGVKTVQSDIYSVGVLMYQMLYGRLPEEQFHEKTEKGPQDTENLQVMDKPLVFPDDNLFELDDDLLKIIAKATHQDLSLRFKSAQEMLRAFDNPNLVCDETVRKVNCQSDPGAVSERGNGFADVAGMQDVKAMLQSSVINILQNRDRANEYGISIPNGIMFYGPPGCGKSFFAEKFAEETGFHYKYVKSSDLASTYIHGTQEKIGQLFREAREKAPTVLCFDEFDALVPKRDAVHNSYQAGEVNEFLSQLNNCGKDGVFVIATTNQPDMIDTAILRKGRIDNIIYLPPPDNVTRQAVFQIHLKDRPCETSINYAYLADLTENYVASDIAYVVNEAAIRAFEKKELISQKMLETLISQSKPSLSRSSLKYYENMRKMFENDESSCNSIGFHP